MNLRRGKRVPGWRAWPTTHRVSSRGPHDPKDGTMDEDDQAYVNGVITSAIDKAATHDIPLNPSDFRVIDGSVYLDGMDPFEWIHAMTMD